MAKVTSFDDANAFQRGMRLFAASGVGSAIFSRTAHHLDRWVAKGTGGKRNFANMLTGIPTVFLTTTGAKSGQLRTVPVLGVPHEAGMGVIASNFGSTKHPAWYHNLRANPSCTVSVDGVEHRATASQAEPAERDRIWAGGLEYYPAWKKYEKRSGDRNIHAFVLHFED